MVWLAGFLKSLEVTECTISELWSCISQLFVYFCAFWRKRHFRACSCTISPAKKGLGLYFLTYLTEAVIGPAAAP